MARSQNKLVFKPRTCHLRFSRRQKISRARHGQVRDVFCPGRKTSKRLFLKSVGLFRCVNRLRKAKRSDPPRSDRNRYNSTSSYVEADSEVSRNALGKSLGSLPEDPPDTSHRRWNLLTGFRSNLHSVSPFTKHR